MVGQGGEGEVQVGGGGGKKGGRVGRGGRWQAGAHVTVITGYGRHVRIEY